MNHSDILLVRPTRIERATPSLGNLCSILLSYGRISLNILLQVNGPVNA